MKNNLKVGDRVKNINPHSKFYNQTATVIYTRGFDNTCLEFDNSISGHDGRSSIFKGKYGHCWWVSSKHYEKIIEETKYNFLSKTKVISSDGEIFTVGDIITPTIKNSVNKGKPFKIKYFRWNNSKTFICAVTSTHSNGIGIDKIQLYIKPKSEFVLPEKWMFLYNNKEEFDAIIKKFPSVGWWDYYDRQNENGYYSNTEGRSHWVATGIGTTKNTLFSRGYVQLTFEQFQKYVPNE